MPRRKKMFSLQTGLRSNKISELLGNSKRRSFTSAEISVLALDQDLTANNKFRRVSLRSGLTAGEISLLITEQELGLPEISELSGVATATYTPLLNELNKPPEVEDVTVAASGPLENGTTLTATPIVIINGPFDVGVNQFQWYRVTETQGGSLVAISGATNNTYILSNDDIGQHVICGVKAVQIGGVNNISDEFFSEMTDQVQWAGDGDIDVAWEDFFEMTVSVPDNWNDPGVNPELINFGTNPNWTAQDASKPTFDVDKLIFGAGEDVDGATNTAGSPAVFEIWVKGKFTANSGTMIRKGSNVLFGIDAGGLYRVGNNSGSIAADFNEHVFRLRFDGANSIFQIDNGVENSFTDNMGSAGTLFLGIMNGEIKRKQRTADGVLLTPTEVADKWTFHGF